MLEQAGRAFHTILRGSFTHATHATHVTHATHAICIAGGGGEARGGGAIQVDGAECVGARDPNVAALAPLHAVACPCLPVHVVACRCMPLLVSFHIVVLSRTVTGESSLEIRLGQWMMRTTKKKESGKDMMKKWDLKARFFARHASE